jgi:hypothetical protein
MIERHDEPVAIELYLRQPIAGFRRRGDELAELWRLGGCSARRLAPGAGGDGCADVFGMAA